jgi:uncharacterized protein (TIGR02301 family)
MRTPVLVLLSLAMLATPLGAAAQARTPVERQTLVDLAYVLGRSHALRQLCAGATDQYWRERMNRLVATEAPDSAFDRQLRVSFNNGFTAAQGGFPRCGPDSRREEAAAAARGRDLATSLTAAVAEDDPSR